MRACWIWGGCEFFPFWGTGLGEGTEMNADFGGRQVCVESTVECKC